MSMARVFALGVVILLLGAQLRVVETFVLNEQATKIINQRLLKQDPATASSTAGLSDPYFAPPPIELQPPSKRSISPPRWLAYSFLSIGIILILTCPLRR